MKPVLGDATELDLGRRFDLILAPASFAQIVGGLDARRALLLAIARHLSETGVAVIAISDVDEVLRECATPAPRRRLRVGGRTFSSRQLAAAEIEDGAQIVWARSVRRRSAGRRKERPVRPTVLTYHRVSADGLAGEARGCGLAMPHVHSDPGDATSLGMTHCVLRRA